MKFYAGVTDWHWYSFLSKLVPEDVNFWQPGGSSSFQAIQQGEPFVFKLKAPYNAIGGVGFFAGQIQLPLSLAWDTFGNRNGFNSLDEFRRVIQGYRKTVDRNPTIGCIALNNPIFFKQQDWVPVPSNWANSIVRGKTYSVEDTIGAQVWAQVAEVLSLYQQSATEAASQLSLVLDAPQYGKSTLAAVRLGQGAFRVALTDAYHKKCAITGEKTLPVLEAAHIRPYAEAGPNVLSNGLLLRSDVHKLFDDGYLTVTPEYKVEVSGRIREEFSNGREYYRLHGQKILFPKTAEALPGRTFLDYHNEVIYRP